MPGPEYATAIAVLVVGMLLLSVVEKGLRLIGERLAANHEQLARIGSHFDIMNGKASSLIYLLEDRQP